MSAVAFRANYHTLKVIGGRKCLQVILEVPLERASEVTGILGFPNPGEEKWVAVALLNEDAQT